MPLASKRLAAKLLVFVRCDADALVGYQWKARGDRAGRAVPIAERAMRRERAIPGLTGLGFELIDVVVEVFQPPFCDRDDLWTRTRREQQIHCQLGMRHG